MTTLLISPEYIKKFTILNDSIDDDRIYPAIVLAQDKHLQVYLGTRLFKAIISKVESDTLADQYSTLVDDYINRMLSWWTMVELLPDMYVSIDNTSVTMRSGATTSSAEKSYLDTLLEKSRQNANFYTQRMIDYLRWNSELFPEYTTNQNDEIPPEFRAHVMSGLTISGSTRLIDTKLRHILGVKL